MPPNVADGIIMLRPERDWPKPKKTRAELLAAIRETLEGVFAAVPYCVDLIGGPYNETHESVVKTFRPNSALRKP